MDVNFCLFIIVAILRMDLKWISAITYDRLAVYLLVLLFLNVCHSGGFAWHRCYFHRESTCSNCIILLKPTNVVIFGESQTLQRCFLFYLDSLLCGNQIIKWILINDVLF